MPLKYAPFLILALAAAIIGHGLWYRAQHPAQVIATGVLEVANAHGAKPETLILETRDVQIGSVMRREIRTPAGNWIDCGGDCRKAIRVALTHVFDEQQERRR